MEYKLSKYCRIYEQDGNRFLYNSRNGIKSHIYDEDLLHQIILLKEGKSINEDQIHPLIKKYKIAVPVNENELSSVLGESEKTLNHNEEELGLIVLTTRNCNFECIYCYESHNTSRIDYATANNLFEAVKDYHRQHPLLKKISVEWFGGEPLLEKKIIYYLSDELIRYCESNSISYSASITSNGFLLDSETQKNLLDRNVSVFQITVDGPKDIHDRNRPMKNGSGTWDTIIKNLEDLKALDRHFNVRLRTNYSFDTFLRADEYLNDMKARFNDPRFRFHFMRINPPEGKDLEIETIDTELDRSVIGLNFDIFNDHDLELDVYLLNFSPCGGVCYARRGNVFAIDTDGSILKCTEYLDHPNNRIGTISEGFFTIYPEKNARWIQPDPRILAEKGCYDCLDFPSCCAGICPAAWAINNNLRCNPYYQYTDKIITSFLRNKINNKL